MSIWNKINNFSEGFARGYIPASQNKYAYQAQQKGEDRREATTIRREERQVARQGARDTARIDMEAAEKLLATGNYEALKRQYPGLWASQFKARAEGIAQKATSTAFEGMGSAVATAADVQATATGPQDQPRIQGALKGVRSAEQDILSRVRDTNSDIRSDEDWEKVYSGLRATSAAAGPTLKQAESRGEQPGLIATSQRLTRQEGQKEFAVDQLAAMKERSTRLGDEDLPTMIKWFGIRYPDMDAPTLKAAAEVEAKQHNSNTAATQLSLLSRLPNATPEDIQTSLADAGLLQDLAPAYGDYLEIWKTTFGQDKNWDIAMAAGPAAALRLIDEGGPTSPYANHRKTVQIAADIEKEVKAVADKDRMKLMGINYMLDKYNSFENKDGENYKKSMEHFRQEFVNAGNVWEGTGTTADTTTAIETVQADEDFNRLKGLIKDETPTDASDGIDLRPIKTKEDLQIFLQNNKELDEDEKLQLYRRILSSGLLSYDPRSSMRMGNISNTVKGMATAVGKAAAPATDYLSRGLNTGGAGIEGLKKPNPFAAPDSTAFDGIMKPKVQTRSGG